MTEAEIELRISRLEAQLLELEAEYETLDEITLRLIAYVGSFDLQVRSCLHLFFLICFRYIILFCFLLLFWGLLDHLCAILVAGRPRADAHCSRRRRRLRQRRKQEEARRPGRILIYILMCRDAKRPSISHLVNL